MPQSSGIRSGFLLADVLPFTAAPIHILDVGAWIEGAPVYQPLLNDLATRIYGVEPSEKAREELKRAYGGRGTWLPDTLGDGETHTFYETEYPGCSSLFQPNPAIVDKFFSFGTVPGTSFHVVNQSSVETTRLNDIDGLDNLDFVKLDIQGAEQMVLEHGMEKIGNALVIQTEASFLPLYIDQPLFGEQHAFLRIHGFELHKFIDITGRALNPFRSTQVWKPISQVIEADAVFCPQSHATAGIDPGRTHQSGANITRRICFD